MEKHHAVPWVFVDAGKPARIQPKTVDVYNFKLCNWARLSDLLFATNGNHEQPTDNKLNCRGQTTHNSHELPYMYINKYNKANILNITARLSGTIQRNYGMVVKRNGRQVLIKIWTFQVAFQDTPGSRQFGIVQIVPYLSSRLKERVLASNCAESWPNYCHAMMSLNLSSGHCSSLGSQHTARHWGS